MAKDEIKEMIGKILDKVDSIESVMDKHTNEFADLHTHISTYHTELLTVSNNFRSLENDYMKQSREHLSVVTAIGENKNSIKAIMDIKDQIMDNCPYCINENGKSQMFKNYDSLHYIG